MTTEVLSFVLGAGQQATAGQGRVWYVKTATAPLTIVAEKKGTGANVRRFVNIGAGFKFTARDGEGWDYLRILSASAQTIELVIGDDDIEVANAVSITGTASVQIAPASTLADTPQVSCLNAALTQVVPVNLARRRVGLSFSTAAVIPSGTVFFRAAAGVNNLIEAQPGVIYNFEGTYAISVRNDSGAAVGCNICEEL